MYLVCLPRPLLVRPSSKEQAAAAERAKAEALHSKEQSQLESAVKQQLERQLHDVQQIAVEQQKRGGSLV